MNADRHGHARITPRQFLQHVEVRNEVEAETLVTLRHSHGQEAEISQFTMDFGIEPILVRIPGLRRGLQALFGELAGEGEDLFRLGGKFERRPGAAAGRHVAA